MKRSPTNGRFSRKLNYAASPLLIKKSIHIFAFQDRAARPKHDKVGALRKEEKKTVEEGRNGKNRN